MAQLGPALIATGAFLKANAAVILQAVAIGAQVGLAFIPQRGGSAEGPQLGDARVQVSTYGNPIPKAFGRVRMAGNVMWLKGNKKDEVRMQDEVGGKGFGGGTTVFSYAYFATFAVLFTQSDPEATSFTRIWMNKKLVYDVNGFPIWKYPTADVRFYLGTSTQLPDQAIEAEKGVDSTPAFRGYTYVVFENLPLKDFANALPFVEVEIQLKAPTANVTNSFSSMNSWQVRQAQEMRSSFFLYFVRQTNAGDTAAQVAMFDLIGNDLFLNTATNPFASELGMSASGFLPLFVLPGDDGRLLCVGRDVGTGDRLICELNPFTLQLIKRIDLTPLFTGIGSGNELERAAITWTAQTSFGTETFSLVPYDGEGGGGPDIDSNDWFLVHRRRIEDASNALGVQQLNFSFTRDAGAGAMEIGGAAADSDGNVWLVGRHTGASADAFGNRGLLIRLSIVAELEITLDGPEVVFKPEVTEFDLNDFPVAVTLTPPLPPVELINLQVNDPYAVAYDGDTNSLVVFGGDYTSSAGGQTIGSQRWVKFDLDTLHTALPVTRNLTSTDVDRPVWDSFGDPRNPERNTSYIQGGFLQGKFLYLGDAGTQWKRLDATDLTTEDSDGPLITNRDFDFWHRDTASVLQWSTIATAIDPVRFFIGAAQLGGEQLDAVLSQVLRDVRVDPTTEASFDVGVQNTVVQGFILSQQGTARDAIEPLAFSYLFDGLESDGLLKFVSRAGASARTIQSDDLGAKPGERGADDPIVTERLQEVELPERVDVRYIDRDRDYQEGTQYASRQRFPTPSTQSSGSNAKQNLPIVMTPADAIKSAEVRLYDAWTARMQNEFSLGPKHLDLDPVDVVTVVTDDRGTLRLRLVATTLAEAFVQKLASAEDDAEVYTAQQTGVGSPSAPQVLLLPGPTEGFLLDIPLLRDVDSPGNLSSGIYLATGAFRSGWSGAQITKSETGAAGPFAPFETNTAKAPWGYLRNAIAAVPNVTHDIAEMGGDQRTSYPPELAEIDPDSTITVSMVEGASGLESKSLFEILNGQNVMVICNENDGPEVVSFTTVTPSGDDVILSGLIRGRRGTEEVGVQDGHPAGTRCVFLTTGNAVRKTLPLSDVAAFKTYRFKSLGEPFDTANLRDLVLTARDLKPYPVDPVDVDLPAGSRAASDVVVTWKRRTRLGGESDFLDGVVDVPLGEESEAYEVDLIDTGGMVDQTKTTTSDSVGVTFTVADRTGAGYGANDAFTVVIYQMSEAVGRGLPRRVTI